MKYVISIFALVAALVILVPNGEREVHAQSTPTTSSTTIRTRGSEDIYKDMLERANATGRLAFVVYWRNGMSGASIRAKQAILEENAAMLRKNFILSDMIIDKRNEQFPILSRKLEGETAPFWFSLKPDGTFVAGGDFDSVGAKGDGPWLETIAKLIEDYPPIPQREWKTIGKTFKAAQKEYDAGNFERVDLAMVKLKVVWWPLELADVCGNLWEAFSTDMAERIDPADQMVLADDFIDATAAYEAIMADLSPKGAIGKDVHRKLDLLKAEDYDTLKAELNGNGEANTAEDESDDEADDEDETQDDDEDTDVEDDDVAVDEDDTTDEVDAADDEDDGDDDDLAVEEEDDETEIVETPPASQPEPPSDEDRAAACVQLAKMYRERDMTDKAIAKAESCIEKYPDTEAAKEARALLKAWK